jgi:peptidoglycan lytic transglycosylase
MSPRHPSRARRTGATLFVLALVAGCATARPVAAVDPPDPPGPPARHARHEHRHGQTGYASYYARAHDGLRTASGERYDMDEMTAAHPTLPFGTRVRVTNLQNGRHAVVRINDRGPFKRGRVIDVSYAAARKLGLVRSGIAKVRLEVLRDEGVARESDDEH